MTIHEFIECDLNDINTAIVNNWIDHNDSTSSIIFYSNSIPADRKPIIEFSTESIKLFNNREDYPNLKHAKDLQKIFILFDTNLLEQ